MEILEEGFFYHIFNRGNNKQKIFLEEENYLYFLKLLNKYIVPIADIYCYCLLDNHFHLLISIKEGTVNPSQSFSNLFNAYTKAFNKRYERVGSLFQRPFKRIRITKEEYLRSLVLYIHHNPENHNLIQDFKKYKFSSYNSILSQSKSNLKKEEIISWFEDMENFKFVHRQRKDIIQDMHKYLLE